MINDLIGLFFPEVCINCKTPRVKGEEVLCTRCLLDLPRTNDHINVQDELLDKFSLYPKVSFVHSFLSFTKQGMVQKMLHALKYGGRQDIGILLGKWYTNRLHDHPVKDFDLILPVPLHTSKKRLRGYNQSDMIAQGLSEGLGIPWEMDTIVREKKTTTQTRMGKVDRWKNVERKFRINHPEKIIGKRVVIVDDVLTTGATIMSCVEEMLNYNVQEIGILVVARPDSK